MKAKFREWLKRMVWVARGIWWRFLEWLDRNMFDGDGGRGGPRYV